MLKGTEKIWDFSDNISNEGSYKLWLQKDTLDRNVVLSTQGLTNFIYNDDTLSIVGKESPLNKIEYNRPQLSIHYPLLYCDSLSAPFAGSGVYCGDHPYREQGISTVMADAKGSIIIDGDTIPNVLRVYTLRSYSICMDVDSTALDTAKLKQVIEERYDWYARGYRYPIFTTITSTSYDNMKVLGTIQEACCMLPEAQSLLADRYNENIRKKASITNAGTAKDNIDIFHYTLYLDDKHITINYSLDESGDITALVCDAMGIVYREDHQHNKNGSGYTIELNTCGLRDGNYVLYINANGKIYSEKVKIR